MTTDLTGAVDETAEGFKEAIKARLANPLLGSFALTWLIANYQLVMVILSGMTIPEKFFYIRHVIYEGSWDGWLHLGLIPAGVAVLMTFLWPIVVGIPVHWFNLWLERGRIAREVESKEGQAADIDEVIALRQSLSARVSKCNTLESEVAVAGRKLRKLEAMNVWLRDADMRECDSAMANFIIGDHFGSKTSSIEVQFSALFQFHKDGTLIGRGGVFNDPLAERLMKWSLDGKDLILSSLDGQAKRVMTFDPKLGIFVGELHGKNNLLGVKWDL
ncbi:hypothetical protein [Stenotrophomonas sp.]|uniref:hypothetical protein n=1 Tax=Stenotrophomonas sp. TaxID=69392 RepID=UPI0028A827CB|nr:hypothetical protein [Stenotrophomonas sp.]